MHKLKALLTMTLVWSAAASAAAAADLPTVWRPANGTWYTEAATVQWGSQAAGDVPLLADMDGDGIADFVVWRPSTGTWYWLTSSSHYTGVGSAQWGNSSLGDVPVPADFDGDGRTDLAVWRAPTGTWYWLTSTSNYDPASSRILQWGNASLGDVPLAGDVDGDGRADPLVWRASTGTWYWLTSSSGYSTASAGTRQWGNSSLGDVPMLAALDGDRRVDLTVWRASDPMFYWLTAASGYSAAGMKAWGSPGDTPMAAPIFNSAPPPAPAPPPPPAPDPTPPPSGGVQLRVLQWNTHHGGYGTDGVYDPDRLATWAASFNPDVVTFNEIERNDYWGNQDQPEVYKALLQQKTGKTWYYVFAQEFGQWGASGKGNLILSTYPIQYANRYELVNNSDRSIALAQITVNGCPITLFSTHLDPYDPSLRLTQATEVTNWAAAQPENRIVTGDMNAWPNQDSIAHYNETYNDSWSVAASAGTATAFPGNNGQTKNGRIDYIFYSKNAGNLSVVSSQVYDTRDASGVMPSDHRPVLTTFVVR